MSPVLSVYERKVEMNTQCILGLGTSNILAHLHFGILSGFRF